MLEPLTFGCGWLSAGKYLLCSWERKTLRRWINSEEALMLFAGTRSAAVRWATWGWFCGIKHCMY